MDSTLFDEYNDVFHPLDVIEGVDPEAPSLTPEAPQSTTATASLNVEVGAPGSQHIEHATESEVTSTSTTHTSALHNRAVRLAAAATLVHAAQHYSADDDDPGRVFDPEYVNSHVPYFRERPRAKITHNSVDSTKPRWTIKLFFRQFPRNCPVVFRFAQPCGYAINGDAGCGKGCADCGDPMDVEELCERGTRRAYSVIQHSDATVDTWVCKLCDLYQRRCEECTDFGQMLRGHFSSRWS